MQNLEKTPLADVGAEPIELLDKTRYDRSSKALPESEENLLQAVMQRLTDIVGKRGTPVKPFFDDAAADDHSAKLYGHVTIPQFRQCLSTKLELQITEAEAKVGHVHAQTMGAWQLRIPSHAASAIDRQHKMSMMLNSQIIQCMQLQPNRADMRQLVCTVQLCTNHSSGSCMACHTAPALVQHASGFWENVTRPHFHPNMYMHVRRPCTAVVSYGVSLPDPFVSMRWLCLQVIVHKFCNEDKPEFVNYIAFSNTVDPPSKYLNQF